MDNAINFYQFMYQTGLNFQELLGQFVPLASGMIHIAAGALVFNLGINKGRNG